MNVLVAAASKHDGTWEIAEAIGQALSTAGIGAQVHRLAAHGDRIDLSRYGAFVLGSGVYVGHWMPPARAFLEDHRQTLQTHPVWLFSSGPVGVVPRPIEDEAVSVDGLVKDTGAREHRLFGGRIDRSRLGFGERALMSALGVSDGDNRDFEAIAEWSASIAAHLIGRPAANVA